MAIQAKVIKGKIRAIGNVGKITKAMEKVSAVKMRKAVSRVLASRPYVFALYDMLGTLLSHTHIRHPYFVKKTGGRVLIVAMSSNRGLCGSIHSHIARSVERYVARHPHTEFELITVGKKMERLRNTLKIPLVASFVDIPDIVASYHVLPLFSYIKDSFDQKKYTKILVAHTHYTSALSHTPVVKQFLPLDAHEIQGVVTSLYKRMHTVEKVRAPSRTFEPGEETVLNYVIPNVLKTKLYSMLLEARACEHSARMLAMKNASDNASSIIDELKVSYNKARQDSITREISEIAAGSM